MSESQLGGLDARSMRIAVAHNYFGSLTFPPSTHHLPPSIHTTPYTQTNTNIQIQTNIQPAYTS